MNRLFKRVLTDRGEGDPLLTIVSAAASVLVSVAIIGALLQVVGLGSRFIEEQTTMSLAGQAQKLWAADAQNATGVTVFDKSKVTFTESDSKSAPLSIDRGEVVGCRVSVWELKAGKLTDTVYTVGSDCVVPAGAQGTPLITLPDVVSGAMNFTNASGRTLTFVAGKATAAGPNTTAYFNDVEWRSVVVKSLSLKSKLKLPLTKVDRDYTAFGTAHLGEDHGLLPSAGTETLPENIVYTPAKPPVTLKQSTTAGTSYAGQREGIDVAWAGVTCGPYSVKYTATWTPTTAGATAKTYTVTSYAKNYSTSFSGVPNGAHGAVTVKAECPGTPPPSATTVVNRTPVKLPALTITAKATTPVSHAISWKPVSSLKTTYDVQVSVDGAAYVSKAKWTAPANNQPTVDVTRVITAATGQTYGRTFKYRVLASVGEAESVTSNVASLAIAWQATPAVKASATETGVVSWNAATCPPGTTNQYQYRTSVNGAWTAWSSWVLTKTVTRALTQGAQVGVEARAHCSNSFSASATTSNGPVYAVKKISTAPSTTATASNNGGGSWTSAGCPAGTTYRYQYRTMTNGAWSGWSAFTTARSVGKATNQGASTGISARARCVSNYTEGPVGGKNDKTTTKPISTIPSTPWVSVPARQRPATTSLFPLARTAHTVQPALAPGTRSQTIGPEPSSPETPDRMAASQPLTIGTPPAMSPITRPPTATPTTPAGARRVEAPQASTSTCPRRAVPEASPPHSPEAPLAAGAYRSRSVAHQTRQAMSSVDGS